MSKTMEALGQERPYKGLEEKPGQMPGEGGRFSVERRLEAGP